MEFLDTTYSLRLLNMFFLFAFRLNITGFGFSVLILSTLSLKVCYYVKVFLKEEVLRNSLEEKIEIAAWKTFASSYLPFSG